MFFFICFVFVFFSCSRVSMALSGRELAKAISTESFEATALFKQSAASFKRALTIACFVFQRPTFLGMNPQVYLASFFARDINYVQLPFFLLHTSFNSLFFCLTLQIVLVF